jgi:DnaJ-domain-containing protein 1
VRPDDILRRSLKRGGLVRLAYRLGRQGASGVLTVAIPRVPGRAEVFALRRGHAISGDGDGASKALIARLVRLVAEDQLDAVFEGGVTSLIPPGASHGVVLADWARAHLEAQLDGSLADLLVRELAGIRLSVRPELAPLPLDEADRRMLGAMALPRRLDQIWPLARTPRFRLLAFLHFLRSVDALVVEGVVAEQSAPIRRIDPRRAAARALLGVGDDADLEDVKRAYRRLARMLHPDLQPAADAGARRVLERRFAEVTAAYEALV